MTLVHQLKKEATLNSFVIPPFRCGDLVGQPLSSPHWQFKEMGSTPPKGREGMPRLTFTTLVVPTPRLRGAVDRNEPR